ncbi:MAG TPA: MgtC/SapB family protein [Gemmatimonadaceae bacterium]|nr:MgtC/SapB family protein [Gemmatimonadaceae bacterium]
MRNRSVTTMVESQLALAWRLAIASLIGLAAGLEREWSGHASGPNGRFAGLRTFFLLGLVGGATGALGAATQTALAGALAVGAVALCVSAYVMAVRRGGATPDGTTEAAAIAIVALGALAGVGWTGLAAGAGAIVVLMLSEKARLHWIVQRLSAPELQAGLRFAALAVVVLPLLPPGPYLGMLGVRPRALWTIVLLFSGLNFAGFIARRIVGAQRGYGIAGALGGLISSTAVTLSYSRQSRASGEPPGALARGVIAACTVLVPRVVIVSAVLNPAVSVALLPLLAPPFVAGLLLVSIGWRQESTAALPSDTAAESPLQFGAAIRMAVAFQVAMLLVAAGRRWLGEPGVLASGAALGLTDIDALTVSLSRADAAFAATTAAQAIAIGVLSNTMLKLTVALVLGAPRYRRRASIGLAALALASAAGLLVA